MLTMKERQAPLANHVGLYRWKQQIPVEVLTHLDAVYDACKGLAAMGSIDAHQMSRTLLDVLLRLYWVRETGKQYSKVNPADVPLKLYQKGRLSKQSLGNLRKCLKGDVVMTLDCAKSLLIRLADDPFEEMRQRIISEKGGAS